MVSLSTNTVFHWDKATDEILEVSWEDATRLQKEYKSTGERDNWNTVGYFSIGADEKMGTRQVSVSTVFLLSIPHGSRSNPDWFETMIFGLESLEDYQVRYKTAEEARQGHNKAVEILLDDIKDYI